MKLIITMLFAVVALNQSAFAETQFDHEINEVCSMQSQFAGGAESKSVPQIAEPLAKACEAMAANDIATVGDYMRIVEKSAVQTRAFYLSSNWQTDVEGSTPNERLQASQSLVNTQLLIDRLANLTIESTIR